MLALSRPRILPLALILSVSHIERGEESAHKRETETQRDREKDRERERVRERARASERERVGERGGRGRERETESEGLFVSFTVCVPLSKQTSAFWEPVLHAIENTFDLENTFYLSNREHITAFGNLSAICSKVHILLKP